MRRLARSLLVAGGLAALFQVLLVILLRAPKLRRWLALRRDWLLVMPRCRLAITRRLGLFLLLRIMIENCRAVLRPHIGPLTIHGSGVMQFPKFIQKLIIGNLRRVILHLYGFGMPSPIRADILIARAIFAPPDVAHGGGLNSL